jgi:RNA polymerase sigma-70 factor, ECF subfamily
MGPNDSFTDLMNRLRTGEDDAAARAVFQRFTSQLIALARRRFGAAFKHKVDPEDLVQSAYKSFFRCHGEGKLAVDSWDSMFGLLTVITLRKCADRVAYYRAECRDTTREASAAPGADDQVPWLETLGREPTPLEEAMLNETVEQLLAGLDEEERPVIELSLLGYTTREISQQLGRAERTVRRLRERARSRLERMQVEAS